MWYLPFSNRAGFYEGDVTEELDSSQINYGNETCFLFDLENDPFERVNLWDRIPFQHIRRTLSSKICDYWENRMVDSLYVADVQGDDKRTMSSAVESNNNFVTWWETTPNMTSDKPMRKLDSKGACPFRHLTGDLSHTGIMGTKTQAGGAPIYPPTKTAPSSPQSTTHREKHTNLGLPVAPTGNLTVAPTGNFT